MKAETVSTFETIKASEDRFQLATYKKMPIAAERGTLNLDCAAANHQSLLLQFRN